MSAAIPPTSQMSSTPPSLSSPSASILTPSSPAGSSASAHCAAPAGTPCSCLDSTELLRGQKAVEISHNGATYKLQATRLGKLILTK